MELEKYIREVKNFPKEGVIFKDITPLLNNSEAVEACLNRIVDLIGDQKIDRVVGVESRGFFFATLLAQKLKAGFVPVRKPGKLPYKKIAVSYDLEYGKDTVEMHIDAIKEGEKVIIHDDVLATGGTAKATCDLVEKLGGEIVQCNFLMEIPFLEGRKKLTGQKITTVL